MIFAVHRNRSAQLAVKEFGKDDQSRCSISGFFHPLQTVDMGHRRLRNDATHPAFLDRSKVKHDPPGEATRLRHTRVKATYDFTHLHDLLLGRKVPPHYLNAKAVETSERLKEINRRINRSQTIDWELLRPFLVRHEPKKYAQPKDSHGTHVAGILAADWPRDGDPVSGICRDIGLIDMRVPRRRQSEEFIIIFAMQFAIPQCQRRDPLRSRCQHEPIDSG